MRVVVVGETPKFAAPFLSPTLILKVIQHLANTNSEFFWRASRLLPDTENS